MSLADELLADLEDDTDAPLLPIENVIDIETKEIVPLEEGVFFIIVIYNS